MSGAPTAWCVRCEAHALTFTNPTGELRYRLHPWAEGGVCPSTGHLVPATAERGVQLPSYRPKQYLPDDDGRGTQP